MNTFLMLAVSAAASLTIGAGAPAARPVAKDTGKVTITKPATGDTVRSPVQVVMQVSGATVVAADGKQVPGQGHLHLFIDTALTPVGQAIPAGVAKIVHLGKGVTETTLPLAPGRHRIIAVLAYGDHVRMPGVATDTVNVVVRPRGPRTRGR